MLTNALLSKVEYDPCCRKQLLRMSSDELMDASTRHENISRHIEGVFGQNIPFSGFALSKLGKMQFAGETTGLTVTVDKCSNVAEVVDVNIGDTLLNNYGLAIDVGTTKIAMYLINLKDGSTVDVGSDYNQQLIYGEDLLSRIDYAFRNVQGLSRLKRASIDTINEIIKRITSKNDMSSDEIIDVCISGNTVMTYLLAELDPSLLVDANVRVSREPIQRRAQNFGIRVNPSAQVYCLPNVSRFVGGDAVADVLASGMYESTDISVLIDMGTNGEIVIGSKGWLLSTSCAAGPAFEGWGIRFGSRSVEGAIEHIKIDPKTFRSICAVIGAPRHKARGICGSGMIDVVAEMYRSKIIDFSGKITDERVSPFIRTGVDGSEYVVSPSSENELQTDIVITQRDINNLLDSKAALCGSVAVLMKKIGAGIMDIDNFYLAGAFGNYIDMKNATTLGIFPDLQKAKVTPLGNGSVAGAYLTLLSARKRAEAEEIAGTMTYYDLTVDPDFMDEYSAALYIPGNPELFPSERKHPHAETAHE